MNKLERHCIIEDIDIERLKTLVKVGDYHRFKVESKLQDSELLTEYDRLNEECNEQLNTQLDNFLRKFDETRHY